MNNVVTAKNISHQFAGRTVLKRISFQIQQGEIFGLLGPSGAGKTTLIKILTGQLRRQEGYSELLGTDTNALGKAEYSKIGSMMDNLGLYERLSVYDNLSFYADIYSCNKENRKLYTHKIFDTLKDIGLYDARNTAVSKLSKGMRNRLSLARTLMNDAAILFLDEPTSGLDPATAKEIHDILLQQRQKGTTIFLTTHNMHEAEVLCDRIALLHNGTIMETGSPENICLKYDHLNKLRVTLKDGTSFELENGRAAAVPLHDCLEQNMIRSIHSTEPDLEAVFIALTGKGLYEI